MSEKPSVVCFWRGPFTEAKINQDIVKHGASCLVQSKFQPHTQNQQLF